MSSTPRSASSETSAPQITVVSGLPWTKTFVIGVKLVARSCAASLVDSGYRGAVASPDELLRAGRDIPVDVALDVLIDDLRRLVEVESPSHEIAALTACASELASIIEVRTGKAPLIIDGVDGPHVHWSGGGEPRVLILGHYDTVFPTGCAWRPAVHRQRLDEPRDQGCST